MDGCRAIVLDTARGSKYIETSFSLFLMLFITPYISSTTKQQENLPFENPSLSAAGTEIFNTSHHVFEP